MTQIDIDADLNMVDDEDRNFARRPADLRGLTVGSVAVAGRPGFWSWVVIDEIADGTVYFRQIDSSEAGSTAGGVLRLMRTRAQDDASPDGEPT